MLSLITMYASVNVFVPLVDETNSKCVILHNQLSRAESHSLETNSHSAGQEIPPPFMEAEGSSPFSQEPAAGPYPEPDESSTHPHMGWTCSMNGEIRNTPKILLGKPEGKSHL
jgi:hypothetical protein